MQEKSNEQRKEQKRGYNLLDKEEEKSMLSKKYCNPFA